MGAPGRHFTYGFIFYVALIKCVALIIVTFIISFTVYKILSLFQKPTTSEPMVPRTSNQVQTIVLNTLSSVAPGDNEGNKILMLLAFSKSLFKTSPEKFTTDTQKVHHVAENLTGKSRLWYAKATLQGEDLLNNYDQFCDALLATVSPALNPNQLRDQISALYQGRMSAQDYTKEFTCLKNVIGMRDNKACYLFHKKIFFELKNFLAHHELATEFDSMVKKVIKWYTKVKQLPSWAKPQNHVPSSAVIIKENMNHPSKVQGEMPKGLIPKEGGGYQLSTEEKQHQTQLGICIYCGKAGHSAKDCQALAKVKSPTALLDSSSNKEPSQSYALLPVKLGSSKTSQEVKALLDTGAMGNFISSSLAQQLGLQEEPSSWVTLANKSCTRVTKIEGNLGVKVRNNQFDIMVSSLSNLAFPLILGFPWAKTAKAVLDLDSMTLSTQKEGITSSISFEQTEHKGILTSEDTLNVLAALKEISQAQIPPELQDLAEAFSEFSCSQLPSHRELDLCINLVPGSVPTWGKLYLVNCA
ncbi:Retrotransposon-derived protein peg10 [Entomophthora muscae]|nr:Retrotransposon-derived protein peg10 [Entomophthora muscae]